MDFLDRGLQCHCHCHYLLPPLVLQQSLPRNSSLRTNKHLHQYLCHDARVCSSFHDIWHRVCYCLCRRKSLSASILRNLGGNGGELAYGNRHFYILTVHDLQTLSPQLIITRVAMGMAWNKDAVDRFTASLAFRVDTSGSISSAVASNDGRSQIVVALATKESNEDMV